MKQKNKYAIFTTLFSVICLAVFIIFFSSFRPDKYSNEPAAPAPERFATPEFPAQIDFCGEEVPLLNIDVKERLDRELIVNKYWHSSTILVLKRASRWFPIIEEILNKNGVPEDFKFLAAIESNLENVVSPKEAVGFWQIKRAAGKQYGLEINNEVDERYHVAKSTEAACEYLKSAREKFGSWTMAAAAYNMGRSGLLRQIERQKSGNYYNLILPDETERYIFRILALKELFRDPVKYGYSLKEDDYYRTVKTKTIKVSTPVDMWADFAIAQGINYRTLKIFNPWLRDHKLVNKKRKTYFIEIPSDDDFEIIQD